MPFDITSILPAILENFTKLIPARIIKNYERGLLYFCGWRLCDISPGWPIVWFPILMSCTIYECATTVIETELQTIETKDNYTISISCAITYNIWSLFNWFSIQDGIASLGNAAQAAITESCRGLTWAEVKDGGDVLSAIQDKLTSVVAEWGVEVESVEIINCAKTRMFRVRD